jgi:hypothetical protein
MEGRIGVGGVVEIEWGKAGGVLGVGWGKRAEEG